MEKIIYIVWRDSRTEPAEFARRLRTTLADKLLALGIISAG